MNRMRLPRFGEWFAGIRTLNRVRSFGRWPSRLGGRKLARSIPLPIATIFKNTGGMDMSVVKRAVAELLGTFWLVFGGCGSAVLAAAFPEVGIGLVGVSLAFGLTVVTMAYAVGHISGGHFNPAVTLGLLAGGRVKANDVIPYVVAQVAGAVLAAWVLSIIGS